jgi:uncharacterized membrane protein required for colicin V production
MQTSMGGKMVSLNFVFWMFVILFALIGAMRGWARELLVTSSSILAIFMITLIEKFAPFIGNALSLQDSVQNLFWARLVMLAVCVFFGYQTPNFPRINASPKLIRGSFQDTLLGLFIGLINGFMIFGSAWFFLKEANYPFDLITAPVAGTAMGDAALNLIKMLPPAWLGAPGIYFAVAVAFAMVIVVLI